MKWIFKIFIIFVFCGFYVRYKQKFKKTILDKHLQFRLVRVSIEVNLILTCRSCSKLWSTGLGRDKCHKQTKSQALQSSGWPQLRWIGVLVACSANTKVGCKTKLGTDMVVKFRPQILRLCRSVNSTLSCHCGLLSPLQTFVKLVRAMILPKPNSLAFRKASTEASCVAKIWGERSQTCTQNHQCMYDFS